MISRPGPIEPDGLFEGLRWSAIVRGAVLDNALTLLVLGALLFYLAGPDGLSDDRELARRAVDQALLSPEYLVFSLVIGLPITSYAAWWAARRAGALHLRHGGWTAIVSLLLGTLFLLLFGTGESPRAPFWYEVVGPVLTLPAGLLGGWIAARSSRGPGVSAA